MPKTFTREPLGLGFRYTCKTELGAYVMGGGWIDTTAPCDMMNYDFTASWPELLKAAAETHANWAKSQVMGVGR